MELNKREADGTSGRAAGLRRVLSPAELVARQETYSGFGNALAVAFELAMVPFLFGLGGWGLDRWLGTSPVFLIVLTLLAVVGLFARTWIEYEQRMQSHDAAAPWARRNPPATPSAPTGPDLGSVSSAGALRSEPGAEGVER